MKKNDFIEIAKQVFTVEARAISSLAERLDESFTRAIERILSSSGRVIISGIGKSGIIGRKISATLASTGTPSFFIHPGDAYHGDLGMVTPDDVFIAISNSGETEEIVKLVSFLNNNGNYFISLTGNPNSTLAKSADCHLNTGVEEEACPLKLAPTSSTTATLAMGDALAVTLMKARDFKPENFARFHPGGSLGRKLLGKVEDEMYKDSLPLVAMDSSVLDIIKIMTDGSCGLAIVRHTNGYGIITDGDIRRALESHKDNIFYKTASELMNSSPITITAGTRIEEALLLMESKKINSLLVIEKSEVIGVFKK